MDIRIEPLLREHLPAVEALQVSSKGLIADRTVPSEISSQFLRKSVSFLSFIAESFNTTDS